MSIFDDLDRASEPQNWMPEPGDTITGVLVRTTTRSNDFGEYTVLSLQDRNEQEWSVACWHASLAKRIKDIDPQFGDGLKIQYEGKKEFTGKDGKPKTFHAYNVVHRSVRATAPVVDKSVLDIDEPEAADAPKLPF